MASEKIISFGFYLLMLTATVLSAKWEEGARCDFHNNDLSNEQTESKDCGVKCGATPGCTHFTWSKDNGGTCRMKKGGATINDAFETTDEDMVCGIMKVPAIPGKKSGRTSRYWDCCKPSCSWPGKVPGNKYTRACFKDGYGTATDPNEGSGCEGGRVYICNNHQPWAVNDQLAYGFAAANILGRDNRDPCCACYKLDFTSGPVVGKSMIVQVTNLEVKQGVEQSSVPRGQFSLQIPGGGVGIYYGCSSQWGAGPIGWGHQFGGVSSRDECDQLPKQIRQGCHWMFDWFKGANNPRMTYSRVRCPDVLIVVSNCKRDDD